MDAKVHGTILRGANLRKAKLGVAQLEMFTIALHWAIMPSGLIHE
jgi:uncharacterized protein YjbI with pentapeptide repeats